MVSCHGTVLRSSVVTIGTTALSSVTVLYMCSTGKLQGFTAFSMQNTV